MKQHPPTSPNEQPALVANAQLIEHQSLSLVLCKPWQIEDAEELAQQLIAQIDGAAITETIPGADRYAVRFSCSEGYFCLNFEEYSESCWIEAEDETSQKSLAKLI